jgi:8-oxo-dGTP diphosphatase
MKGLGLAVKSFIINNNKELLLIKRQDNEIHCPGAWEVPGGRLELGENPFDALRRETKEETSLDIEILNPLRVNFFERDDGQTITMISFLCRPVSNSVVLSEEHSDYQWIDIEKAFYTIHQAFRKDLEIFKKNFFK